MFILHIHVKFVSPFHRRASEFFRAKALLCALCVSVANPFSRYSEYLQEFTDNPLLVAASGRAVRNYSYLKIMGPYPEDPSGSRCTFGTGMLVYEPG